MSRSKTHFFKALTNSWGLPSAVSLIAANPVVCKIGVFKTAPLVKVLPGWCWPPSRCNEETSRDSSRNLPPPRCSRYSRNNSSFDKDLPGRRMFWLHRPRFCGLQTPCELGSAPSHLCKTYKFVANMPRFFWKRGHLVERSMQHLQTACPRPPLGSETLLAENPLGRRRNCKRIRRLRRLRILRKIRRIRRKQIGWI